MNNLIGGAFIGFLQLNIIRGELNTEILEFTYNDKNITDVLVKCSNKDVEFQIKI
jgi:hypothetical protein